MKESRIRAPFHTHSYSYIILQDFFIRSSSILPNTYLKIIQILSSTNTDWPLPAPKREKNLVIES